MVDPDSPQIIWRMRIACWVRKATDTHLEYVILIVFLLQQRSEEHASVLCNMYFAVLFYWRNVYFVLVEYLR